MKNIHSKQEFILIKEQQLNEGLFSRIGKVFKNISGNKELKAKLKEYKDNIDSIFAKMQTAEISKTAAANNDKIENKDKNPTQPTPAEQPTQPTQESKINEAEIAGSNTVAPEKNKEETPDNTKNLNEDQLKQLIEVSKKRIEQLTNNFNNEVDAIKKKKTGNDGTVPKKLEYRVAIIKNQLSDHVFKKWEEFFNSAGNKEELAKTQKERVKVTQNMKKLSSELEHMMKSADDEEKRTFVKGTEYHYKNQKGEDKKITVTEIGDEGNVVSATLVNLDGETVTINPHTDQIGKKVEKPTQPNEEENEIDDPQNTDGTDPKKDKVEKVVQNTDKNNAT